MYNNDQCLQECFVYSEVFTNEGKMDNEQKYRTSSLPCTHGVRWALDGGGPQPPAVARALEGHRQLLHDIAARRGVPLPAAFCAPADVPGGGDAGDSRPLQASTPISSPAAAAAPCTCRSYMGLLRRHLDALRQLMAGAETRGAGEAAFGKSEVMANTLSELGEGQRVLPARATDTRSDDSGVSSNQSSSCSLTLQLTVASTKNILQSEDQETDETLQLKNMEVRRTPGSAGLEVDTRTLEADFPLRALQDEVRRHREFLTQVWSKRRMPPPPYTCHGGDSDTALSLYKGASRPYQITDQQLREGAEAVLRALDEALESSSQEDVSERRPPLPTKDESDEVRRKIEELEKRHKQLQLENIQLKQQLLQRDALADPQQMMQGDKGQQQPSASGMPRAEGDAGEETAVQMPFLQTSQTFLTLTSNTLPNVTGVDYERKSKKETSTRWTTRKYLEKLAQRRRRGRSEMSDPLETTTDPNITMEYSRLSSKTTIFNDESTISRNPSVDEKTYIKESLTIKQGDTIVSDVSNGVPRERFDRHDANMACKTGVKSEKVDFQRLRDRGNSGYSSPQRQINSSNSSPQRHGSPRREQFAEKTQRRKVRSQSLCLPYAHLSFILQAKMKGVRRSLSAGAHRFQRALATLPRRVVSNSSCIAVRVQNWYRLGETSLDLPEGIATPSLPSGLPVLTTAARSRGAQSLLGRPSSVSRTERRTATAPGCVGGGCTGCAASYAAGYDAGCVAGCAGGSRCAGCARGSDCRPPGDASEISPAAPPSSSPPRTPTPVADACKEALLTLRVEAPPASGRRLQKHLARLSEPEPRELPALQMSKLITPMLMKSGKN